MTEIAIYYDGFRERLLEDYRVGNKRVVAALNFAKKALAGSHSVLDVGCGIGWSSSEMAATGAMVTGLDFSPALIETAREMFGDCVRFQVSDFAEWEPEPFDAVLMVDVYEHFPRESRSRVHARIRNSGAQKLVLSMPTPEAQQFARDHDIPLQPVDEDVTDADVARLAQDVDGEIVLNELVTIWRQNDYRHVLVEL